MHVYGAPILLTSGWLPTCPEPCSTSQKARGRTPALMLTPCMCKVLGADERVLWLVPPILRALDDRPRFHAANVVCRCSKPGKSSSAAMWHDRHSIKAQLDLIAAGQHTCPALCSQLPPFQPATPARTHLHAWQPTGGPHGAGGPVESKRHRPPSQCTAGSTAA